jgi:hypothetical protein
VAQVTLAGIEARTATDLDGGSLAIAHLGDGLVVTLARPATAEQPGVVMLSGGQP